MRERGSAFGVLSGDLVVLGATRNHVDDFVVQGPATGRLPATLVS